MSFSETRFLVGRELGKGASGIVYEAYDVQRKQKVALKRLRDEDPAAIRRFQREFVTLSKVTHENLVRLYDVGKSEGPAFFTMELVRGIDLISYLRPQGPLPDIIFEEEDTETVEMPPDSEDAITLEARPGRAAADYSRMESSLRQLVDVVSAMHAAGYVHRDLKSANILVEPNGRVVVLDLGIAALHHEGQEPQEGIDTYAGTPAYMAPEQLAGAAPTPAMDWYAVGMILYRALTGERPFHGSMESVRRAKQEIELPPPLQRVSGLPRYLSDLCHALLSRDPAKRPTGYEILRILDVAAMR